MTMTNAIVMAIAIELTPDPSSVDSKEKASDAEYPHATRCKGCTHELTTEMRYEVCNCNTMLRPHSE